MFFANLPSYLAYFSPQPVHNVVTTAFTARCGHRRVPRVALGHRSAPDRSRRRRRLWAYHYFDGDPVDTEAGTAAWQQWLNDLFPAPEPVPTSPRFAPGALVLGVRRVRRRTP